MEIRPRLELRRSTPSRGPVQALNPLDATIARLTDARPAFAASVRTWRKVIVAELRGRYWLPPAGSRRPWAPTKPFGTRPASPQPLGQDYQSAWGGGPGSIESVGPRAAVFGVSGARFPWAQYQRGGTDAVRVADVGKRGILLSSAAQVRPWKLAGGRANQKGPQRFALWWALFFKYGVKLRASTLARGLFIPFRPHATLNPEVTTRITAIMAAHVAGRPLPEPEGV